MIKKSKLLLLLFIFSHSYFYGVEIVVEMKNNRYVPAEITIKKGDTIRFINRDKASHDVVIEALGIKTKYVRKIGEEISLSITEVGVFDYFCTPHKRMGMVGKITIEG